MQMVKEQPLRLVYLQGRKTMKNNWIARKNWWIVIVKPNSNLTKHGLNNKKSQYSR